MEVRLIQQIPIYILKLFRPSFLAAATFSPTKAEPDTPQSTLLND